MPFRYRAEIGRRAFRLSRRWEGDRSERPLSPGGGSAGTGGSKRDRAYGSNGFSERARRAMRWEINCLAADALGEWPVMMTLTLPRDWRSVCGTAKDLRRLIEAFKE